jgi:hypothetical protein
MRIARLCLVILIALTTATLSAAPKKGGHLIQNPTQNKSACPYWFECYSGGYYDCCAGACTCKGACIDECGGPCEWDDSCPYLS